MAPPPCFFMGMGQTERPFKEVIMEKIIIEAYRMDCGKWLYGDTERISVLREDGRIIASAAGGGGEVGIAAEWAAEYLPEWYGESTHVLSPKGNLALIQVEKIIAAEGVVNPENIPCHWDYRWQKLKKTIIEEQRS